MTLICVWRDQSYDVDRLIALGDMRISSKVSTEKMAPRNVISDLSRKLIPITVACHDCAAVQPVTGAMGEPYAKMEIGVAFSGAVLEAQTIVHHIQHGLSNLVATMGGEPQVSPDAVGEWTRRLVERYFATHNNAHKLTVTLIIFGWKGETPWHQTVRWEKIAATLEGGGFDDATFLHTGEDSKRVFEAVQELRLAILGHKRRMSDEFDVEDGVFEADLVRSLHDSAARRVAEQGMIDKILSKIDDSIGGALQKLELAPEQRAACTRMSGDYALEQDMSLSADGPLVPFDLTEDMGRRCGGAPSPPA